MTVTYLHHSAFLVETESASLLFDWFSGEKPEIREGKPLYVLASHVHEDHFSRKVFALADVCPEVTFLLSRDIPQEVVPETCIACTHFLGPNEIWQDEILYLETFRSTDEGVAFWCRLDGKQLYHAGDLNHWYWEGEDEQWNRNMTESYRAEIARMADRRLDAAFLPVDPRLGDWFYLGADDFMKTVGARNLFPMHFWGDFTVCDKLREHPCSEGYRENILRISKKGQTFSI